MKQNFVKYERTSMPRESGILAVGTHVARVVGLTSCALYLATGIYALVLDIKYNRRNNLNK